MFLFNDTSLVVSQVAVSRTESELPLEGAKLEAVAEVIEAELTLSRTSVVTLSGSEINKYSK